MNTGSPCHGWDQNGFGPDDAPSPVVAKPNKKGAFIMPMRTGEVATGQARPSDRAASAVIEAALASPETIASDGSPRTSATPG